jgi:hypothetical protein
MNEMTVEVFSFGIYNGTLDEMLMSKYKATRETIATFGGVPWGSGEWVAADQLDGNGRYLPPA